MSMMTIRQADADDLLTVHALIHTAARWLHARGLDQWPDDSPTLGYERLGEQIRRGKTYLVSDGRDPVATVAVSTVGDPDFWTPAELAESAVYVSKAAVARRGEGIGALLMRWVIDRAARDGVPCVRLDAWRTNRELHDYYRGQGWDYVRTIELPHRRSGVLFQIPAAPDPEARTALAWQEQPDWRNLPSMVRRPDVSQPGTPVIVSTPDGPVAATVKKAVRDWGYDITSHGWEHGAVGPAARVVVARGDRTWTPRPDQIWADRFAVLAATEAE